jgi:hypothetical protein
VMIPSRSDLRRAGMSLAKTDGYAVRRPGLRPIYRNPAAASSPDVAPKASKQRRALLRRLWCRLPVLQGVCAKEHCVLRVLPPIVGLPTVRCCWVRLAPESVGRTPRAQGVRAATTV